MQSAHHDESAIRALIDRSFEAIRNKNADEATRHYTADIVTFTLAPPLGSEPGEDRNPAGVQAWFDTWDGPIGYEVQDLVVEASEHLAFARAYCRMRGTKTDGETPDLWFRLTLCFRNEGSQWKIAHEHASVPFYMDGSYKAAVDLKP